MVIIEPFQHYEVLHSLLRMVIATGTTATVITNDFCKKHINLKNDNFIIWHTARNTEAVIQQQKLLLKNAAKILFTTINPSSVFWKWEKFDSQISAFAHNAHNLFNLKSYRVPSPIYRIKYGLYQLRGDYQQQKYILERLTTVLVPDTQIAIHLQKVVYSSQKHKIKVLPFAFPQHTATIYSKEAINITIPGTISNTLRDYNSVAKIIKQVDEAINTPVRLRLLGRLKETPISILFDKIKLYNIQLEIFTDYIPPELFLDKMLETDFLLLPIQEKIIYKSHYEYRGQSSVSGNINDLISYGLPAILPSFYPLDEAVEKMTTRYKNEYDLANVLTQWISQRSYNEIKENSRRSLAAYKAEVLKKFTALF